MSSLLKHPVTILVSVVIGAVIGLCNVPISNLLRIPNFAGLISFPGQLYLFFLQMTVIPIIITAISSSLGKLIRNKSSAGLIRRIVIVFIACMIGCALIGMTIGILGKPGAGLDENTRSLLAKLISSTENEGISGALEINLASIQEVNTAVQRPSMAKFFRDLIPSNIFQALSLGTTMAIVFFSIIFGVAIGSLSEESSTMLINLLSAIFQSFQKLINWSLYLLPFGLICLLAGQIAAVGIQIFMAMSKFITLYCVGTILIFIICTLVIWFRSGNPPPFRLLSSLFEPILLAFATRNSMATLPSAITCLDKQLRFDSPSVNLTLPLGMTLGRFGNIFYFGLAVFFVVQIYDAPLEFMHYLIILIGVIFSGTATAGASGIVTLSMISIVLDPLSLPMEAILIIFMAIDPLIDPFRTFLIVYVNMAATTLIAQKDGNGKSRPQAENAYPEEKVLPVKSHPQEDLIKEAQSFGRYERIGEKTRTLKPLLIYVQETRDRPPLLYRRGEIMEGIEIQFLREVARRLNRPIQIQDSRTLSYEERARMKQEAELIAGVIKESTVHPPNFSLSQSWASVSEGGIKEPVYFLLSAKSFDRVRIDRIIKTLKGEHFLSSLKESQDR